ARCGGVLQSKVDARIRTKIGWHAATSRPKLSGVVVPVVLDFEQQGFPRCLPRHAAKDTDRATEHRIAVEVTRLLDAWTHIEAIVYPAEGVAEIARASKISGCKADAGIHGAETLTGYQILTGEEAGAADIARAERHFRAPSAFSPEPDLEIDRLVLEVLVAAQWAICHGGVVDVTVRSLKPRTRLHGDAVPGVGRGVAGGESELAFLRHACRWRLQEAYGSPIVLGCWNLRLQASAYSQA